MLSCFWFGLSASLFWGFSEGPLPQLHGVSPMALLRAEVLPLHRQQEESLQGVAWFSRDEWTAARSTGSLQQAV